MATPSHACFSALCLLLVSATSFDKFTDRLCPLWPCTLYLVPCTLYIVPCFEFYVIQFKTAQSLWVISQSSNRTNILVLNQLLFSIAYLHTLWNNLQTAMFFFLGFKQFQLKRSCKIVSLSVANGWNFHYSWLLLKLHMTEFMKTVQMKNAFLCIHWPTSIRTSKSLQAMTTETQRGR